MTQPEGAQPGSPAADQRRAGRPRNRRDEIIRAALDVFAERGFRGTSLAAVAARVGLSQQGLLHYFPTKDALLAEVLLLHDSLDFGRALAGPAGAASPQHLADLVAFEATRPGIAQSFMVLAAESLTDDHPARAYFVKRYADLRAEAAVALRAEPGTRLASGLAADQAAALLIAVIDGLRLQWLLAPDEVDLAALFGAFVTLVDPAP
jgi:AcrR family transcriptional regulator